MKNILIILGVALLGFIAWRFISPTHDVQSTLHNSQLSNQPVSSVESDIDEQRSVTDPRMPSMETDKASSVSAPAEGRGHVRPPTDSHPLAGSAFEASFLTNGMVNDRALKSLESKNFDAVVNALDAQNAGRRNDVAENYRKQIEGSLASFEEQKQIDRFACGVNVCLTSIRSTAEDKWFNDWYENVQTATTSQIGSLAEYAVKLPGGIVEHRLLFTTNPGSAGFFVGPATTPPPSAP